MSGRVSVFAALLGRPNVGKTSLLCRLVGRKVGAVSAKPQTTRRKAAGVLHRGDTEFVFLDTPGFGKPRNRLGEELARTAESVALDADVAVLVADASPKFRLSPEHLPPAEDALLNKIKTAGVPAVLALNKCDLVRDKSDLLPVISLYSSLADFAAVVPVSAKTGNGVSDLLAELGEFASPSPWYYPEGETSDVPDSVMAGELIREKCLRSLREEVPHGVAVEVEECRRVSGRNGEKLRVSAVIWCEKESHKGIIIGKKGETLRGIAAAAREDMERYFGAGTELELWVKVKPGWRDDPAAIRRFGLEYKE